MKHGKPFLDIILNFFNKKNWKLHNCPKCGRKFIQKKGVSFECFKCNPYIPDNKNKTIKNTDFSTKVNILSKTKEQISKLMKDICNIDTVEPLDICSKLNNHIFIGSGIDYIFSYKYRNLPLPKLPVVIFQPSIRLKFKLNKMKDIDNLNKNGFSISFINVSIIRLLNDDNDFSLYLDQIITLFSKLGIHANRLCFLIDPNRHQLKDDGYTLVLVIYIDGIEVGDHVALISNKGNKNFIESGFGLERLAYCLSKDFQYNLESEYMNNTSICLIFHVLTLFLMSSVPFSYTDAWSKMSILAKNLKGYLGSFDTFLVFNQFYDYWKPFVASRPITNRFTAYIQFLNMMNIKI